MKQYTYVPLTETQRGIYFECAENPSSTKYNNPFYVMLPETADIDRLTDAVGEVILKHPAFFVTVTMSDDGPVMCRPDEGDIPVEVVEASSVEEFGARFIKPFDIENGPLARFAVCLTDKGNAFFFDVQHLIFDGTSLRILLTQIVDAYNGKQLADETVTLFDIAEKEQGIEKTDTYKADFDFFRDKLGGVEFEPTLLSDVNTLPAGEKDGTSSKRDEPDGLAYERAFKDNALSPAVIEPFCKANGVTESTLFMGAFAYTFSIFQGSHESSFTTVHSGRYKKNLENTLGAFVKTVPIHLDIDDDSSVVDYLKGVQDTLYSSMKHETVPFSVLAREYGVSTSTSFVYQGTLISEIELEGVPLMPVEMNQGDPVSDLTCQVVKSDAGYAARMFFRKSVYSSALVESFTATMEKVAAGFTKAGTLAEVELVTDETRAVYADINSKELPIPEGTTIQSLLQDVLAHHPERTALVYNEASYTYAQFDSLTACIAAYISAQGLGAEDFVAVLAPRSDLAFFALWGAIRAGAAILPLDPTYPSERLEFMMADCSAKLLIADRSMRRLVAGFSGPVLYTDELAALPEAGAVKAESADNSAGGPAKTESTDKAPAAFKTDAAPTDAFCIIYTSGTTGKPKGCILENRNLVAFTLNHQKTNFFTPESRVAHYASFGFDAGIMDIVTTTLAGAALYIIPDDKRLDINWLEDFYCKNGITNGFMTTQVGRMFCEQTKCKTLKSFVLGGEKLVPFTPPEHFAVLNGYGPCESFAYIAYYRVKDNGPIQPVGKPWANTRVYITSQNGRLLPCGAPGELCISGAQVGRGYLGQPDKTAAAFVANPFENCRGMYDRMYKTGDIVRLLHDGNIDFVGRRDGQVKIRGFRIELTEVEEVIRRFDGIADATVTAFDEEGGGKFLAAYVVGKAAGVRESGSASGSSSIDIEALKSFIRSEKPAYMVPAFIMQLDAIPYTQNGKVNRRQLPKPGLEAFSGAVSGNSAGTGGAPVSEAEKKVAQIAAGIIGLQDFGIDADFFECGLTSIGVLKLNMQLSKAFNRPLTINEIRDNSTVRRLAKLLTGAPESGLSTESDNTAYPLRQNQMGVFIEMQHDLSSLKYNIPMLFKLSSEVDAERLKKAVEKAIEAHPYINARLKTEADGTVAAYQADEAPVVSVKHVKHIPNLEGLVEPFTIEGGALYRAEIYITGKGKYLLLDFHHIIGDGTSTAIFLNSVNEAYEGKEPEKETFTGFDASLLERDARGSLTHLAASEYWKNLLSGNPTDCLPAKCPESADSRGVLKYTHPFSSSDAVRAFCNGKKLTFNAFFNAAFCFTLARFLHTDDVTYCTVYNGRYDSRLAECFCMLVRSLPVRCTLSSSDAVSDFVSSMQMQLFDSMTNDSVSLAELSKSYGVDTDIFFNYQGDLFTFDTIAGKPAKVYTLTVDEAKAPLCIEIFLKDGVFTAEVTYRSDYYCREFISSLMNALDTAASGFTDRKKLSDVSLTSESVKSFYEELNKTDKPYRPIPAHAFIDEYAETLADRIAVRTKTTFITFSELRDMADQIARSLVKRGLNLDEPVGFVSERNEFVPAVQLGIMKAGGATLNMLPSYPDDRIDYSLADSGARFVITSNEIRDARTDLFSGDKPYKAITVEELLTDDVPKTGEGGDKLPDVGQNNLAYVIYTSGSTGKPKGVMIEHHSMSCFNQVASLCDFVDAGTSIFCMSSISFDMSICEIMLSLSHGKSIYIATEEEIHDFDLMREAFIKNGIDMALMTPSLAWNLLSVKEFEPLFAKLKAIALGAEAFQPGLFTKLRAINPDMLIFNGYGPTETTQSSSAKKVTSGENITIGRPQTNTQYFVFDEFLRPLPPYAVGELIIGGEGVCRGYVNMPERNAEMFITVNGVRAYRSGDLVRLNRDGEAEFCGRKDNQVKLRGFRIELDEIENVIDQYDGVIQSKVIVRNNGKDDYLAAFFTAKTKIDVEVLAAFLKTKLTYYMIPQVFMQLDQMPMTSNGKIDKKALPETNVVHKERVKKAPKKSLEEKIVDLFKTTLEADECYVDDNFFEIGGSSLSASKVVMQLKAEGWNIEYQDIFDHQTAEELAAYLEGAGSLSAAASQAGTNPLSEPDAAPWLHEAPSDVLGVLSHNTRAFSEEVKREPLGNVLLTGATGFLGSHVMRELIESEKGKIICLLRKGSTADIESKLKATLSYYFNDDFAALFGSRIKLVEGDITDEGLESVLTGTHIDTIINCAASVKHYANDDSIEFVNVHGVENLIALAKARDARLIQISTASVPGAHTDESYIKRIVMSEDELFVIDDMNNQYCRSKYQAELRMFQAIKDGMRGKVIRVGNLMGRYSDGVFQQNMRTNAFLNGLRGFVYIGKSPISHATDPMSFSPIDLTARAVVLLSGVNDQFTAFHAESRYQFDEMKLFEAVNRCGLPIKPVADKEYYADFYRLMADEKANANVSALLTNDRPGMHMVNCSSEFTADILYRLGFSWPFTDDSYLERVITSLKEHDFFKF